LLSAYQYDQASKEPHWKPAKVAKLRAQQPSIANWLYDRSSLTARLKQHCHFSVQIHSVAKRLAYPSENKILGLPQKTVCLIREVHLLCGNTPVVFARTCIPLNTLSGTYQQLSCLGRKPLGELLFSGPHIHRGIVEIASFSQQNVLFHRATQAKGVSKIWGRRSLFHLPQQPALLVNEVFLPTIDTMAR
jgi:chorismate--pyruvate lyase